MTSTSAPSQRPTLLDVTARYMTTLYEARLRGCQEPPLPERLVHRVQLICDCERIADVAAKAYGHQGKHPHRCTRISSHLTFAVTLPWSAEVYAEHLSPRQSGRYLAAELKLEEVFQPLNPSRRITVPTIVLDNVGNILLWYLPNSITTGRRVGTFASHQSAFPHISSCRTRSCKRQAT